MKKLKHRTIEIFEEYYNSDGKTTIDIADFIRRHWVDFHEWSRLKEDFFHPSGNGTDNCLHPKYITAELWADKYKKQRSLKGQLFNILPIVQYCEDCGKDITNLMLCPKDFYEKK